MLGAGALATEVGVIVIETEPVTLELGSSFPPVVATNYTIYAEYLETAVGLTGGDAAIYRVTDTLLTTQPTDGVIIGWIRHPGGGVALSADHITNAPKLSSWELSQTSAARQPVNLQPPHLVLAATAGTPLGADVSETSGFDQANNVPWRGAINSGAMLESGVLLLSYRAYAPPYRWRLRSITPAGCTISMQAYDTNHVLCNSTMIAGNLTWTWDTLSLMPGCAWAAGEVALLELHMVLGVGQTIQLAELEVDFWPFGLSRT